jgi:hypothetical protein
MKYLIILFLLVGCKSELYKCKESCKHSDKFNYEVNYCMYMCEYNDAKDKVSSCMRKCEDPFVNDPDYGLLFSHE